MILVVTYELKQPTESYSKLFEVLKRRDWAHYMSSTWFVATDISPQALFQELAPHIFDSDRIMITKLVPGYHGWLPGKAWDWINRNR